MRRPDGIASRVSIATPNNTHFEIAKAALEYGVHVVCEKPLCFAVAEAENLARPRRGDRRRSSVSPMATPVIR